jgi:hypothetical protein
MGTSHRRPRFGLLVHNPSRWADNKPILETQKHPTKRAIVLVPVLTLCLGVSTVVVPLSSDCAAYLTTKYLNSPQPASPHLQAEIV